jgi:hypothetical protein
MTLAGVYSAAGLTLTGTITDGSDILSISAVESSVRAGNYFGYYDELTGSTRTSSDMIVRYDNFSVAVPEPGVAALLIAGLTIILLFHRGQRRSQRI